MFVLGIGDSLRGSASVADKIDYTVHGVGGSTPDLLAEGQLPLADSELLAASAITIGKAITLVNTHTTAITVNLSLLKSGSAARQWIPKDLSLGIGYLLMTDGVRFAVFDTSGNLQTGVGGIATAPIWAAAGDLLQGIGNDAGEVLSIGAANLKAFVNAAGTKVEWASGIYVGSVSRDTATASGTQAITGVGFKPSAVIFLTAIDNTPQGSIGFDDDTTSIGLINKHNVSAGTWDLNPSQAIFCWQTDSIYGYATINSLDADGFTLVWTKVGAKTGTADVAYLAFR